MAQQTLPVRRGSWILSTCAASALLLAGCGSSTDPVPGAAPAPGESAVAIAAQTKVDAVAALLPQDVRQKGSLTVASDASYPPMESIAADGKTLVGLDPDLGKALGEVMGIRFEYVNSSFDAIIPGLQAKKFDIGMSGFNDTEARRKTLTFVDYYKGGSSLFIPAGGKDLAGIEDLCGSKVAVQKGTVQQEDATAQDVKCKQAGKSPVEIQVYPDQTAANLALASGRATVSIADTPIAIYQVQQSAGKFKVVGAEYGVVMHGIAVLKDSPLVKPLVAALKVLMENGTYQKVLDKWKLGQTRLDQPLVNSAPVQE
jgi:polar amino acid transport system substrate-binding protein